MTERRSKNEQELIGILNTAGRSYRKLVNRVLVTRGLSDSQALPILFIGRLGDGVRMGVLAEHVGVEVPSLVRQIDQLCAAGLVERRDDPTDRRAKSLHLTESGRLQAGIIEALFKDLRSSMLQGTSDDDLATTLKVLRGFEKALAGETGTKG
jgi:MarR family transcriptional regulator for hemolysin